METRHQIKKKKLEKEQRAIKKKEAKRAKTLFVRKDKRIRKNDMIVNLSVNKINLEQEQNSTPEDVKQEMDDEVAEVKSESMEFEEDVNIVNVEEKLDLSEIGNPCCSSSMVGASSSSRDDLFSGEQSLSMEKLRELREEKDLENYNQKVTLKECRLENKYPFEQLGPVRAELETEANPGASGRPQVEDSQSLHGDSLSPEEKVLCHFPDVLKILVEQRERENGLTNWEKLVPILKLCRLVCKSWKQSIDTLLENDSSHVELCRNPNNPTDYKLYTPCPFVLVNLEKKSTVPWFLELQQLNGIDPNYNPVPTRHFKMLYNCDHQNNLDWSSYLQLVMRYLKQFGKQVWYLTVDIRGPEGTDSNKFYKCFCDMLELIPNILSIALYLWNQSYVRYVGKDCKLERISFPRLQKLVTFQCTGNNRLFHDILESNRHIQRLSFLDHYFAPTPSSLLEISFPNLSEVRYVVNKKESWEKFTSVTWKIGKLILYLTHRVKDLSLLESLQNFGNTLKILSINLWSADGSKLLDVKLNLPQLTSLQIVSHSSRVSRNWESFLGQLVSLETFTLEQIYHHGYSAVESKAFVENINSFYSKLDWTKLHKLKKVCLTVQVNKKRIGKSLHFSIKRSDGEVLRYDLVSIHAKELKSPSDDNVD